MSFDLKGVQAMKARLAEIREQKSRQIRAGLTDFGEQVIAKAKSPEQTPVLTGTLRSTEHVEPVTQTGNVYTVTVAAGGPAAPYAVRVHEDLEMRHPRGGKAKFLEDPLNDLASQATTIVAEHLK